MILKHVNSYKHFPWPSTSEQLFNLKFAAKELQSNSKKCDKEEKTEKAKVKKVNNKQTILWLQHVYDLYFKYELFISLFYAM